MKIEYVQVYSGGIGFPKLKVIEVLGEPIQYFYDEKKIKEKKFNKLFQLMKQDDAFGAHKTIKVYDDFQQIITEVSYIDNDTKSDLTAKVKTDNHNFEYKQIRQKRGKTEPRPNVLAKSYIQISFGDKESEYIDRQPALDDPLLEQRDKILKPYLDIFDGKASLSILSTSNIKTRS